MFQQINNYLNSDKAPVLILFILICIFLSLSILPGFYSGSWPSVQGEVIDSYVATSYKTFGGFGPAVTYKYQVSNQLYVGQNVTFSMVKAQETFSDKGVVELIHKTYFPHARVPVYYNPSKPGESVLMPGLCWGDYLGMIFLVFLAIFLNYIIPKWKKSVQS